MPLPAITLPFAVQAYGIMPLLKHEFFFEGEFCVQRSSVPLWQQFVAGVHNAPKSSLVRLVKRP